MRELGIEDSSLLAFHMKKLEKLVKKNEKGYYELTDLGWRAYRIIRELELESIAERVGEAVEGPREGPTEREGGVVEVRGAIKYTVTRDMVERLYQSGKKLRIVDVVVLDFESGIDPEKLDRVLESVEDVVLVSAPPDVSGVVKTKCRDVLVFSNGTTQIQRLPTFIGAIVSDVVDRTLKTVFGTIVKDFIKGATKDLVKGLPRGIIVFGSAKPRVSKTVTDYDPRIVLKIVGSDIELQSSRSVLSIDGEARTASIVRENGSTVVKVLDFDGNIAVPTERVEELLLELSGGDVRGSLEAPKRFRAKIAGGDVELDVKGSSETEEIVFEASGGDIYTDLDLSRVTKDVTVSADVSGGDVDMTIVVPKDVNVVLESIDAIGGDIETDIEPPSSPTAERPKIRLRLKASGGDIRLTIHRK